MRCARCGESRFGTIVRFPIKLPGSTEPVAICHDCNLILQGKTWLEEHHPFGKEVKFTIKVCRNEHELMERTKRLCWDSEECAGISLKSVERLRQDIHEFITDGDRKAAAILALADYEKKGGWALHAVPVQ